MNTRTIADQKLRENFRMMLGLFALGCVNSHAATILIDFDDGVAGGGHDVAIRNGGFESGSDLTGDASFSGVDDWINMRGFESVQATINTLAATGFRAAIMSGNQSLYALDTGHTIQIGDQFSGRFDWRTAANSEVSDVMRITLFFTTDNTLPNTATVGDATDIYSFTANDAATLNTYETASWTSQTIGLGDVAVGKTLMFRFESLGTTVPAPFEFGRVDNVFLQAVPEPAAALLGGLGMLALLRRRR